MPFVEVELSEGSEDVNVNLKVLKLFQEPPLFSMLSKRVLYFCRLFPWLELERTSEFRAGKLCRCSCSNVLGSRAF